MAQCVKHDYIYRQSKADTVLPPLAGKLNIVVLMKSVYTTTIVIKSS